MKIQAENKSLLLNPNFSISMILLSLHPTNAEIPVPPSRSKKSSAIYFIISKGFSRLPTLKSFKEQVTELKKEKLNCPHNNFFSDKAEEIAEKITGQVASFLKENPNKVPETIDLINKFLKIESNKNE